jgi:PadR family transcriptional regulator, regulatory protein PadR
MPPTRSPRPTILPGTLDLLILRTLLFGPLHGHGIGKHIRQTSEDVLQVEHGSLYPALQRLERDGLIASNWAEDARGREMKFYRLTTAGRKQLTVEESKWKQIVRAMARMMRPV